jgi:hypothetical protein
MGNGLTSGTEEEAMKKSWAWFPAVIAVVAGAAFIWYMNYSFENSQLVRELFSGSGSGVLGEVSENSGETLAMRARFTGKISMLIFSVITVLQFLAFGFGVAAVSKIRTSSDSAGLKLKRLDSSDIIFDVPLYVGLFGTVSAFLVMTFSPQSSRLIAYSSTLIGIIFSLLLRLTMQFPLKNRLLAEAEDQGAAK